MDPRTAFIGEAARLDSPLGPLDLGVVDVQVPGIAEGVSRLLMRSIQDAREETGGHLPSWLVRDIERNYISPEKVRTLWAATGHRFALVLDREIVGTIHIAKSDAIILTVDRHIINVDESAHPGFKPPRHHHVVNISVRHELRRAHLGRRMVEDIVTHFRHLFAGEGLWVRADPPWHPGLAGLGFTHDPTLDVFLPPSVERTAGLPHDVFNQRYACDCGPKRPELATHKLQYVSMSRPFALGARVAVPAGPPPLDPPSDAYARDYGGVTLLPRAVARPSSIDELAALLAWATREKRRVTVRGQGQSHAGQSLGADVVLSTERLNRVVASANESLTVEGGMTWRELAIASAVPAVVPQHVDASIGGTLASFGVGFGSVKEGLAIDQVRSLLVVTGDGRRVACSPMQAAWLFDAVLGGYGQFGVIAEATLRLPPEPPSFESHRRSVDTIDEVLALFERPSTLAGSIRIAAAGFLVRTDWAGSRRTLRLDVRERAPAVPATGAITQVVVPRAALAPLVTWLRAHGPEDAIVHPFASRGRGLFVPRVEGELVFAFTLSRHDEAFIAEAQRHGGAPTLQSGTKDLRAFLGGRHARARTAKRLADPADVLGSPHLIWPA